MTKHISAQHTQGFCNPVAQYLALEFIQPTTTCIATKEIQYYEEKLKRTLEMIMSELGFAVDRK